jgi:hypothetical protein
LNSIYLEEINRRKKEKKRDVAAARASWLALDRIEAASAWRARLDTLPEWAFCLMGQLPVGHGWLGAVAHQGTRTHRIDRIDRRRQSGSARDRRFL